MKFRRIAAMALGAGVSLMLVGAAAANGNGAGGVTGPDFYVDGELYRTVGTPTDFSNTGAPDHSYDTIYAIDGQPNVAEAAPGDTDYNGGRWMVVKISYDESMGVLMSADDVQDALDAGAATDEGVVASFECPVIEMPKGNGR